MLKSQQWDLQHEYGQERVGGWIGTLLGRPFIPAEAALAPSSKITETEPTDEQWLGNFGGASRHRMHHSRTNTFQEEESRWILSTQAVLFFSHSIA